MTDGGGTDGAPDAGWWKASDGEWYPPHTHPDPAYRSRHEAPSPAPPEPPDPIPVRPRAGVSRRAALVSLAVVAAGAGIVWAAERGDPAPAAGPAGSTAPPLTTPPPEGSAVTDPCAPVTETTEGDAPTYTLTPHRFFPSDSPSCIDETEFDFATCAVTPEVAVGGNRDDDPAVARPTVHRRLADDLPTSGAPPGVRVDLPAAPSELEAFVPRHAVLEVALPALPAECGAEVADRTLELDLDPGLVPSFLGQPAVAAGWSCSGILQQGPDGEQPADHWHVSCRGGADPGPIRFGMLLDIGWESIPAGQADVGVTAPLAGPRIADFGEPVSVSASLSTTAVILGMGDSYSSGEGSGDYVDGTGHIGGCHRSVDSWQNLWAGHILTGTDGTPADWLHESLTDAAVTFTTATGSRFVQVACSGGVSADFYAPQPGNANPAQIAIFDPEIADQHSRRAALDGEVDAIVLTIGGNDVAFAPVLEFCALESLNCQESDLFSPSVGHRDVDRLHRAINAFHDPLVEVLGDLRARTTEGPRDLGAATYISSYPLLFPAEASVPCFATLGLVGDAELAWMRRHTEDLAHITRAAADAAGVHYVDALAAFEDNQFCEDDTPPAMNGFGLALPGGRQQQEAVHPTTVGFALWATDVIAAAGEITPNPQPGTNWERDHRELVEWAKENDDDALERWEFAALPAYDSGADRSEIAAAMKDARTLYCGRHHPGSCQDDWEATADRDNGTSAGAWALDFWNHCGFDGEERTVAEMRASMGGRCPGRWGLLLGPEFVAD